MKKTRKGYLKRYLLFNLREKGGVLILGGLFLLGTVLGSRLLSMEQDELYELLTALESVRTEDTEDFRTMLESGFLAGGTVILLLFFNGFCAVGQPLSAFLLFYRGLGFGLTGAYLLSQGQASFRYYIMALLPEMLFELAIQVAAARESILFSLRFLQQLLPVDNIRSEQATVRMYVARFVFFLLLTAACSFMAAALHLFAAGITA